MIQYFHTPWRDVPLVVIDVETTGIRIGIDRAVSCALVRFEKGCPVDWVSSFIDPGMPIPSESTAIHGITDSVVMGAPTIEEFFASGRAIELLSGAQPAAYNAPFDREFVPRTAFSDWLWPWIDPLVFVRSVDKYARGKGRHTLSAACERHKVKLESAHGAMADAKAAGELFYKIAPSALASAADLRSVLKSQRELEIGQWEDFAAWKASQPNV